MSQIRFISFSFRMFLKFGFRLETAFHVEALREINLVNVYSSLVELVYGLHAELSWLIRLILF